MPAGFPATREHQPDAAGAAASRALHHYTIATAAATLFLIFVGGLVTSTGSGLAVPDWPLSFGRLFPPMVGGVFYEHGHRMVAASVGILTVILAIWVWQREPRPWVRRLAAASLAAIIVQGLLGGLTVLLRLPTAVSVLHASLAQFFFGLVVTLAVCTGPWWRRLEQHGAAVVTEAAGPRGSAGMLFLGSLLTTLLIYAQIILGAVMRHLGAGLAIPDFPLAFGRLVPPLAFPPVIIHYLHRLGALAVTLAVIYLVTRVRARSGPHDGLRGTAWMLLGILFAQLALGAATIWSHRAVPPTTLHVAGGAALLAVSLILTLRSFRVWRAAAGRFAATHGLISEQAPA
ncbi:MAG: heme A synthase [Candidatus Tectomicrobia bacterium]|nr:heme A synthase [Candidatus Tectomicrobia bacterium]